MSVNDEQMRAQPIEWPSVTAALEPVREMEARQEAKRPQPKTFSSWIEGHPRLIAELDTAVQDYRLERVQWREHKVGWRTVRLVFELRGPAAKVDEFVAAYDAWIKRLREAASG